MKSFESLYDSDALVLWTKLQNGGGLSTRPQRNVVRNVEWNLELKILQHANRLLNSKRQYLSPKNVQKMKNKTSDDVFVACYHDACFLINMQILIKK